MGHRQHLTTRAENSCSWLITAVIGSNRGQLPPATAMREQVRDRFDEHVPGPSPPAPGRRASRAAVRRAGRARKHLTSWGSMIRFTGQVGLD